MLIDNDDFWSILKEAADALDVILKEAAEAMDVGEFELLNVGELATAATASVPVAEHPKQNCTAKQLGAPKTIDFILEIDNANPSPT